MRYILSIICAALLATLLALPAAALSAGDIVSEAALLMDADTGQVLFDKGMHRRMFPASTTKVMTALLVSEHCQPDEIVTVRKSAVQIDEWDSSHIALQPGEKTTVDELLYALMLPSANDAANALAEHVAGSQEAFAQMMNERAREIGAVNTNFTNAHGLHDASHYSTAYDIALITNHAMQNPMFQVYFGADLHTMPSTNLQDQERYFTNLQYMVVADTMYYNEDVLGGKVGYTTEARHTMTTVAQRDGRRLICVVLKSVNRWEKFYDTRALLDYGFEEFRPITLPAASFTSDSIPVGEDMVTFFSDGDFSALLRRDIDESQVRVNYQLPDSFERDSTLPDAVEVVISSDERTLPAVLGTQPIHNDLPPEIEAIPAAASASVQETASSGQWYGGKLPWAVLALVVVVLLVVAGWFAAFHYRLLKRRRKRLAQLRRMRGSEPRKSA